MYDRLSAIALVLAAVLTLVPEAKAQTPPTPTTFGISASFQDTDGLNIVPGIVSFPIWMTPEFVLAPQVGFLAQENGTDRFSIGADGRFVLERARVAPYIGPGLRILNRDFEGNRDSETDLVLSGFGGAEYFLAPNFSMAVEGRLEILTGDNSVVTTTGVIRASVYF